MSYHWRMFLIVTLLAAILVLSSTSVDAQCAMCRAVLSGSNNGRFMRNFNIGVLVLLLPPVSIFCSIFIILRKHRGDGSQEDLEPPDVSRSKQD